MPVMAADILMVYCTVPDAETAERLARAVVSERLAACVNVLPGIRSIYRWDGAVESSDELLLIAKTARSSFDALRDRLVALHPYELPEIVAVKLDLGSPDYVDWVRRESAGTGTGSAD